MSGIYGFVSYKNISHPIDTLHKMQEAIPFQGPSRKYQWTSEEGRVGLGTIHPIRIGGARYFAQDSIHGIHCIYDGIIYCNDSGNGNGNGRRDLVKFDGAAFLLEQYLKSGIDCLKNIIGSFNVAFWDERACRLILANDKLGHRPLFWGEKNGSFIFASLLARIMATGMIFPEIDVESFADLISYEYSIGERTLFKDIHTLPPASYLVYEKNKLQIKQYWRVDHIEPYGVYDKRRLDELVDIFKLAVKRSIRPDITSSIALTGGMDSRCILAAAANQKLSFAAHTMGQPDSTDVLLAKQVCDRARVTHSFELIRPHILSDWLIPMVLHQGGLMATLHSHPCHYLFDPPSFDAIIQGVGGCIYRGFWVPQAALHIGDIHTAQNFLRSRLLGKKKPRYVSQIWRPEFRTLGTHVPERHVNMVFSEYDSQNSLATRMIYFFLHQRDRKFLNKGVLVVRPMVDVYLPYYDHQLVEALFAIPISERVKNRIHIDLIRILYPKILDIPYAATLLPLSTPQWKINMVKYYRGIKRKTCEKLGISHRDTIEVPNAYYSQWIRKDMRNTLYELLYNPQAAFRAYLRWEAVEMLLNQHFSGRENWEPLIAALTVFEIVHKLWVNPEKSCIESLIAQSSYADLKKAS